MKSYESNGFVKVHVLRLDQGEDLLESIEHFAAEKDIREGAVVSGVATLDCAVLHMITTTGYPPKEYFRHWENEPLELVSLQGVIANYKPHLHVTISNREEAYGGHVEKGCRILYLGEFVIIEFACTEAPHRAPNEHGVSTLV